MRSGLPPGHGFRQDTLVQMDQLERDCDRMVCTSLLMRGPERGGPRPFNRSLFRYCTHWLPFMYKEGQRSHLDEVDLCWR